MVLRVLLAAVLLATPGANARSRLLSGNRRCSRQALQDLTLRVGQDQFRFATSTRCQEAHDHFMLGLGLYFAFWYDRAVDAFRCARQYDPGFAAAAAGEALSHDFPLWEMHGLEMGRAALRAINETYIGPALSRPDADPPSTRMSCESRRDRDEALSSDHGLTTDDKGLIRAARALFGDGATRVERYRDLLSSLAETLGDGGQLELRTLRGFYALAVAAPGALGYVLRGWSLLSVGHSDAVAVLEDAPSHAAALHLFVHSVDLPGASLADARRGAALADAAPDSSHNQHMPTHVWLRRGDWRAVVSGNENGLQASLAYARANKLEERTTADLHSVQFLIYGLMQQRRFRQAKRVLNQWMRPQTAGEWRHPLWRTRYALLASAVALESGDMALAGRSEPAPAPILCDSTCGDVDGNPGVHNWVAQGNAASIYAWARARLSYGALEDVSEAQARLQAVAEEVEAKYPGRLLPLAINATAMQLEGWRLLAGGREGEAVRSLTSTCLHFAALGPAQYGPIFPIEPCEEALAAVELAAGRPRAALTAAQQALARYPKRTPAVILAVKSTAALCDLPLMRHYKAVLQESVGDVGGHMPRVRPPSSECLATHTVLEEPVPEGEEEEGQAGAAGQLLGLASPTLLGTVCALASVAAVFLAGRAVGRRSAQPAPFHLVGARGLDDKDGGAAADQSKRGAAPAERTEASSVPEASPSKAPSHTTHGPELRRRA